MPPSRNHSMKTMSLEAKRVALILGARHNFWLDQRVQRTARALVSGGYRVIAYTPVESRDNEHPAEGVATKYIAAPGGANKLFKKLLLDYLLYNIPAAVDMRRNKVDICHCNDFDTLPCGVLLKLITLGRAKIVYDSHEDYPLFVEEGYGKLLGKLIGVAEAAFTGLFVDQVISVNEAIKAKFEKRGIRSESIFNCQELLEDAAVCTDRINADKDGDFRVAYQGNITPIRGYEQLIEAADILVNKRGIENLRFIIIGKSTPDASYGEHIKKLVAERGLERHFLFTGFVSYTEMMRMLKYSDIGLILFQPTPNNRGGLPNKLFENLAASIPTIASNFPEMARIIREENCGLLVDPTKPEEIADAIEYLYRHEDIKLEMGRNARRAAQEKYNFASQAEKLLKLYENF